MLLEDATAKHVKQSPTGLHIGLGAWSCIIQWSSPLFIHMTSRQKQEEALKITISPPCRPVSVHVHDEHSGVE